MEQRDAFRWNNKRYALVGFRPTHYGISEESGLHCSFVLTDYASFLAINQQLDVPGLVSDAAGQGVTIREKYFPRFDTEKPNVYTTHSFGIDLCVITKDQKMILVQRSEHVAVGKGLFSIPVDEGMLFPQDLDLAGQPSFLKAAKRGLLEEVGLDTEALGISDRRFEFLNFGAVATTNEYTILGVVHLPLDTDQVEEHYVGMARDRPAGNAVQTVCGRLLD